MRGFILLNFRTAKFSTRELRVSVPLRGFMLDNPLSSGALENSWLQRTFAAENFFHQKTYLFFVLSRFKALILAVRLKIIFIFVFDNISAFSFILSHPFPTQEQKVSFGTNPHPIFPHLSTFFESDASEHQ